MLGKRKRVEEERIRQWGEDLLKAVAHRRDLEGTWEPEGMLPPEAAHQAERVMAQLEASEQAVWKEGGWRLTPQGRVRALELLRAHRLVETYLARKEGRAPSDLHAEADEAEHHMTPEGINQLADLMNRPRFDPHGDPIPERARDLHRVEQIHLKDTPEGMLAQVAHIEDEPASDFVVLNEMGLALELPLRVVSQTTRSTGIELAGEMLELPTHLAAHIEVVPYPESI
ncbi:MAG TPA: iron dependent repressor, metal binding and dimerization domain protein, partial [Oceanipulchritudo sp.]|nr:iron dependent repressor, metal binding and dimerization domain protein [Oceanipulchritudo sp.]